MNNITKHFLGIFILTTMALSSIFIIRTCKTSVRKVENTKTYSNKELENEIHNILKLSKERLGIAQKLFLNDNNLFFMYSNNECSTCIDQALLDLYVLSKDNILSKKVIVVTPELDNKEIRKLSLKYDNLLKFVSLDHEAWDLYLSTLNGINSIYFVAKSDLSVEDCYVFNPHNDKSNQLYYDFIKKKHNL